MFIQFCDRNLDTVTFHSSALAIGTHTEMMYSRVDAKLVEGGDVWAMYCIQHQDIVLRQEWF